MVDQVFQVAEQERQHRLPLRHKNGGDATREIGVVQERKAFLNVGAVALDRCGLFAQLGAVCQPFRLSGGEDRAESRDAIEQMADKLARGPSTG